MLNPRTLLCTTDILKCLLQWENKLETPLLNLYQIYGFCGNLLSSKMCECINIKHLR